MKKQYVEKMIFIFWIFMLGSLLGFVHENLLTTFRGHHILRKGLIYEPLIPVYGMGLVCFCWIFSKFKGNKKIKSIIMAFFASFLMGGLVEYIFSFLQEAIFGTISWDYSRYAHNILGRTSLYHCTIWGLMGLVFYIFIYPLIIKLKSYINNNWVKKLTILFAIILALDCTISCLACLRQSERRKGIVATNKMDEFLDRNYPDEMLEHIFNNARIPKR